MAWIYAVVWIASMVVTYSMMPKAQNSKPATLNGYEVPTAEEGREIPVLFGTVENMKAPMIVWYGDFEALPVKRKGGKK